jgi:hypothetical protein
MRTARALVFSAGLALSMGITLASAGALAQPSTGASSALAEALFQQGRDLFKREQYPQACAKFAESQRLEPKLGTLLNLALCDEKAGKIATAWAEYTSAAAIARREGQKEREDFAREQVELLGKKLAHVILKVDAPPAGLTINLDGKPLDGAVLNAPLPIDPGRHFLMVTAPGKTGWSTVLEVPPQRVDIPMEIPALEDAPATMPPPLPPPPAPEQKPAPVQEPALGVAGPLRPAPAPAPRTASLLAITGFSIGAAGVIVGVATGAATLAKSGALLKVCKEGRCPVSESGELSAANALANVSNVGFVFGAAGVGVGIAGLLMSRQRDTTAPPGVAVTPVLGPGAIGLQGRF